MDKRLERARSELLIIRLRRGETEAFRALVEMWERRIFYFVRRIVTGEQDAWDVLQETWLKVHSSLRQLKDISAFPEWIYRISRNIAISHLRRTQRLELLQKEVQHQEIQEETNMNIFSEDEAGLIHWGLDQLPLAQREVLTLFFLEDFSLREICNITRVSEGTVKSRLYYGKQTLRKIIEEEGRCHEQRTER